MILSSPLKDTSWNPEGSLKDYYSLIPGNLFLGIEPLSHKDKSQSNPPKPEALFAQSYPPIRPQFHPLETLQLEVAPRSKTDRELRDPTRLYI